MEETFTALGEQNVTVAGTAAVEIVIPRIATHIKELKHQRAILATVPLQGFGRNFGSRSYFLDGCATLLPCFGRIIY